MKCSCSRRMTSTRSLAATIADTAGITALELIVVLSVVGLTFLFSLPGVASYRDSVELNQAVTQVASHLALARQKAVTEHNDYMLTFLSDTQYTVLDDDNSNGLKDAGEKELGPYELPGMARVTYLAPGSTVTFSPSGMLGNPTLQVTVEITNGNGATKGLTVWPSGSIELHSS
jgi:type II secretory pathway pseudopilin PulG